MALMNCPECNNQVSSTAASCPHCGAPIAEAIGRKAPGAPLTTIQGTSKRLKLHVILSSIVFWIGVVWLIVGINTAKEGEQSSAVPVIFLLVGVVWYVVTRYRIWWHHK